MNISIDNEKDSFSEIKVNGYTGYSIEETDYSYIIWSDGVSLYRLTGNIPLEKIKSIAESIQ